MVDIELIIDKAIKELGELLVPCGTRYHLYKYTGSDATKGLLSTIAERRGRKYSRSERREKEINQPGLGFLIRYDLDSESIYMDIEVTTEVTRKSPEKMLENMQIYALNEFKFPLEFDLEQIEDAISSMRGESNKYFVKTNVQLTALDTSNPTKAKRQIVEYVRQFLKAVDYALKK
ncbi:MAG: hypothetical protein ABII01_00335 [Candidatus Woesearchaeota archaeon]